MAPFPGGGSPPRRAQACGVEDGSVNSEVFFDDAEAFFTMSLRSFGAIAALVAFGVLDASGARAADDAAAKPPASDSDLQKESNQAGNTTASDEGGTGKTLQER